MQESIGLSLGDSDLYKNNPDQIPKLQARIKTIEEDLMILMARWEELLQRSES